MWKYSVQYLLTLTSNTLFGMPVIVSIPDCQYTRLSVYEYLQTVYRILLVSQQLQNTVEPDYNDIGLLHQ